MALAQVQSSISDLFAPRANDSRLAHAQKKRAERPRAGDFGALVADYSARPQAKAPRKQAQEQSNSEVANRAKATGNSAHDTSSKSIASKNNTSKNTYSKTFASKGASLNTAQDTHHDTRQDRAQTVQPRDIATNIGGSVVQRPNDELTALSGKVQSYPLTFEGQVYFSDNIFEPIAVTSTGEVSPMGADALQQGLGSRAFNPTSFNSVSFDSIANPAVNRAFLEMPIATLSSGGLGLELPVATAPNASHSPLGDSEANIEATANQFGNRQDATVNSVNAFVEAPKSELSEVSRAGMAQKPVAQIDVSDGLRSKALFDRFDVQALDDSLKSVGQVGRMALNAKTDNLNALEQLQSIKSLAPNVMRALVPQKQGRRVESVASKNSASQVLSEASQLVGGAPKGAIELSDATSKQQTMTKEFLALQQTRIDGVIAPEGEAAALEGALQVQSERGELEASAKTSAANHAGKLVIPERFGATLRSGVQSLRLQIAPKHLGSAELIVKLVKDHVQGTLTVTSEAAKIVALSSLDLLAERLSKEGLTLDALNVEVSQDDANQGRNDLERQYSDVLRNGLLRRAFERNSQSYTETDAPQDNRPLMAKVINARGVDMLV